MPVFLKHSVEKLTTGTETNKVLVVVALSEAADRAQKTRFLKKPNALGSFAFFLLAGFGLYWVFRFFYLNKQLGSLLVDLAHQLSFYLDSPILDII